jgi:hypothetical protein
VNADNFDGTGWCDASDVLFAVLLCEDSLFSISQSGWILPPTPSPNRFVHCGAKSKIPFQKTNPQLVTLWLIWCLSRGFVIIGGHFDEWHSVGLLIYQVNDNTVINNYIKKNRSAHCAHDHLFIPTHGTVYCFVLRSWRCRFNRQNTQEGTSVYMT